MMGREIEKLIIRDNSAILNKNANIAKIFSGAYMHITRDKYLEKIIAKMNNGLVKTITGIRRCGKLYLLHDIFIPYLK